jgi:hypothetical protein
MRHCIFAMLLCLAGAASAQVIKGTVTDGASRPLAGVLVAVIDRSSAVRGRALSDEQGRFTLVAPAPGAYQVRTTRIGYRPIVSEPIVLADGQVVNRQFALSIVPLALDTVRAQAKVACRMTTADSAIAAWRVWEQVRTALAAGQLTTESEQLSATVARYERTLEPLRRQIVVQKTVVASDVIRQPWRSIPPDSLRRVGYVVDSSDFMIYSAPSLEVLSSDGFIEDHCFGISIANSDLIGVSFEPIRERRKIPEIRGTAWVDTKTGVLRRIDYRYANVSKDVDAEAGGLMEFTQLRTGTWAITRWLIRMPHFSLFEGMFGFESKLVDYKVTGGELLVVTSTPTHDTLWSREPVQLTGTVLDSASGRPIRNARISVAGTAAVGASDDAGKFSIDAVAPGNYVVEVRTASLDSVNAVHQSAILLTDSMPPATLRVPNGAQVAALLCGAHTTSLGILVGTVRLAAEPATRVNATVTATWSDESFSGDASRPARHVRTAPTTLTGAYTLCDLPVDAALTLRAETPDADAVTTIQIPRDRRSWRVDMTLEKREKVAVFTGVVLADSTRQPIPDAEVELPALSKVVSTNARGEFRVADIAPGQQHVIVRRIGYGPLDTNIQFDAARALHDTIILARVAILDSVFVNSEARDPGMEDFEKHRLLGLGHFMTGADIAKFEMGHTEDVLAQTPGIKLLRGRGGRAWVAGSRGVKSLKTMSDTVTTEDAHVGAKSGICYAKVYIDNTAVYTSSRTGMPRALFDINSIPPNSIEAIEYYSGAAQIPTEYMGLNTECGVLVIRTRR